MHAYVTCDKAKAKMQIGCFLISHTFSCPPPLRSPPVFFAASAVLAALAGDSMTPTCPSSRSNHRGFLDSRLSLQEEFEWAPEQSKTRPPATVSTRVAWDRKALAFAMSSSFLCSTGWAVQIARFERLSSSTVGCFIVCMNKYSTYIVSGVYCSMTKSVTGSIMRLTLGYTNGQQDTTWSPQSVVSYFAWTSTLRTLSLVFTVTWLRVSLALLWD